MSLISTPQKPLVLAALFASACLGSFPANALNISNMPLFLGADVEPNIMFILDDSGSMQWEILPDDGIWSFYTFPRAPNYYGSDTDIGSDYENWVPTFEDGFVYSAWARSPQTNRVYYNPAITYTPWANADGSLKPNALPGKAYHNPVRTERGYRDLTVINTESAIWDKCTGNPFAAAPCATGNEVQSFNPAVYFFYSGNDVWNLANYTKVEIRKDIPEYTGHGRINRTDCNNGKCTYDQEIQNFANWYTYYRSRILASRAGIGKAFAKLGTNMRVGFGAINRGLSTVDGVDTSTIVNGVRSFSDPDRTDFFTTLYGYTFPPYGTPLRFALDNAGKYFQRTDNRGPWVSTPGTPDDTPPLECRQNYTILSTDGYWNDPPPATVLNLNIDGTSGPSHTDEKGNTFTYTAEAPFSDNWNSTLADIAMYYWKNDLRTDLPNNVPVNQDDPAFWQHMVTFGVGLGVTGSVDPDTAFAAINTKTPIAWGDPLFTNAAKLDDLLHAAVNSRGGFFSAADPMTFANKLSAMLEAIVKRAAGSASAISATAAELDTGSMIFQARFNSADWSGNLRAFRLCTKDLITTGTCTQLGKVITPAFWDGGETVTAQGLSNRDLYSYNGQGVSFLFGNVPGTLTEAQINYLRGDKTNEKTASHPTGLFRERSSINGLLGDIINSAPTYIYKKNYLYHLLPGAEGTNYLSFRNSVTYKARRPLVAVGSNDGMLHVFNASATDANRGKEIFGYVPGTILNSLAQLTQTSYTHKYFVDGPIAVNDAYLDADGDGDKNWRTILAGTLGAGGKGLFALDVSFMNPADDTYSSSTGESTFSTSRILWEINNTTNGFSELGYTFGQPSIERMADGNFAAIFANGYNSNSQQAGIYIVNIKTGALIKYFSTGVGSATNQNGMSAPIAVDANGDRIIDAIYAGDLRGNVWKIDVHDSEPSNWDFAYKTGTTPLPFFSATSSAAIIQPITAKLEASRHPEGGVMIYFGTGKYFETGDSTVPTNPLVNTFYAIRDACVNVSGVASSCATTSPNISRTDLVQQTITEEQVEGTKPNQIYKLFSSRNEVDYSTQKGWYMNLLQPSSETGSGQRVLGKANFVAPSTINFKIINPSKSSCSDNSKTWLLWLDAISGKSSVDPKIDINQDGKVDKQDVSVVTNNGVTSNEAAAGVGYNGQSLGDSVDAIRIGDGTQKNIIADTSDSFQDPTTSDGVQRGRTSWIQLR